MFLLCINKRVAADVASDLLCVTACIQGRDFIVARSGVEGTGQSSHLGFGQKKWDKDRSITILSLGLSHYKPDLEGKLNSLQ